MTQPPPYSPGAQPQLSPADEKLWSILTHIGGILFSFIMPLVTYLVLRDRGPFVRAHTATALNFQLTLLIAWIAVIVLSLLTFGIASILILPVLVLAILFPILAAVATNRGQWYRYPVAIRFVS